jgi:glycosyltransferase involved in cell wall biosynthesis
MSLQLSIIIPTYNRARMLREALESILKQPSVSIQIVVADDASTDDTPAVCEEFKTKALLAGMDFLMIKTELNKGAPFLRNEGFRQSSGDVVMFMDSDDVLERGVLAHLIQQFEVAGIEFIYGKVKMANATLDPLPGEIVGAPFTRCGRDLGGYHWQTMGAIYRRKFLERVGPWDENLSGSQDWEFQARVKMAASNWRYINIVIGLWRQHKGSRVGTDSFRLDYVQSACKACLLIRDAAKGVSLLDEALKKRLASKLMVHAVELEVNGYPEERKWVLANASELLPEWSVTSILVRFFNLSPYLVSRGLLVAFSLRRCLRGNMKLTGKAESERSLCEFPSIVSPTVSIMITSKNRREELIRTCKVLKRLDPPPLEVLITADGCTDDTVECVKKEFPEAILIVNHTGLGSVGSRSHMMKIAQGDLVLSLDDDSYPEQMDCLAALALEFETNPRLAVATFPQRSDEYPASLMQKDFGEKRPIRNFPNSGACFRVFAYRQLVGFEPIFFHVYEETDYALQCIAGGWDITLVPSVTIRHYFTSAMRNEIRNHQRHARNELWGTLIRCPFPQAFALIGYRILAHVFYAAKRGPSWLVREPVWWWQALKGTPAALKLRNPVSWKGYMKWVCMPD